MKQTDATRDLRRQYWSRTNLEIRLKMKHTRILFTDNQCIIAGVSYPGIPLLIDHLNQVIPGASDWLRHLVVMRARAKGSVRQFAYHLKHWWDYLIRTNTAWDQVDDSLMITWRDLHLMHLDHGTVNSYISTVFRMYLWAEKHGYVNDLIGEADLATNRRPPLSVEVVENRRGTYKYCSPLLKRTVGKPVLPTPTNENITKIHESLVGIYGDNAKLMIRDALMLTWAELNGTRRMEVLSLKVSNIPSWEELATLEQSDCRKEITITGKGGKIRSLWVSADLLSQTREYIEYERSELVRRWRQRLGSSYEVPEEVFLSSKTGKVLDKDTVSQKFAIAFRAADVKGSLHRVRARFITNVVFNALEGSIEKLGSIPDAASLLVPVAELAGHSNVETLAPYLALGKKRLLRQTSVERAAAFKERANSAERRFDANLLRLRSSIAALNLVKALGSRHKGTILKALVEICDAHGIDKVHLSQWLHSSIKPAQSRSKL